MILRLIEKTNVYSIKENNIEIGLEFENRLKTKNNDSAFEFLFSVECPIYIAKTPVVIDNKKYSEFYLVFVYNTFKILETKNQLEYFYTSKENTDIVFKTLSLDGRNKRLAKINYVRSHILNPMNNRSYIELNLD